MLAEDRRHNPAAFAHAMEHLFRDVPVRHMRVLEIGSGRGLISLYLAMQGASVVSLEPEAVGSTSGVIATQRARITALGLERSVELVIADFNTWESDERFDLILSRASINHLYASNRNANRHPETWAGYQRVAERIHRKLAPGGTFLATDANRYAAFSMLQPYGIRRPWRRHKMGVNWRDHQNISTWCAIFRAAGFRDTSGRYPVPYRMRAVERLIDNAVANFCLSGAFIFTARP
jgi:cyclopropane fatty-acyl-phospholipid synthase-like methyltransferase